MKFSERPLTILKSFSTINKSILMKEGNVLKTITPEKTLVAKATITDQIPSQACIYDLSRFLSILGLYKDPDVEFHDKYFTIAEGKQRTKYAFADISMIHAAPEKDIELPTGADDYGIEIGETSDEFKVIIKTDNLKLLPQDYQVTLCAKGISEFKGNDATYYVAIDTKSTYKKG